MAPKSVKNSGEKAAKKRSRDEMAKEPNNVLDGFGDAEDAPTIADAGTEDFDGGKKGTGNKKSKKSGGFQSLGLSRNVLNGIVKLGYNVPTPIQRKALPVALSGRDVVAMARTGSGKTAAFLIPLVEKLQSHSSVVGARGIVLSPTRELAQQTYRFAIKMGKFTTLRACLLQGGDSLTAQFEALSNNPDIIVATPGRLVHLLAEVHDLSLKRVEMLIVDEADRLFEMGFALQLKEILDKIPEQRQTLLFSATMPVQLMEFTRAGLQDPELIRLDAEHKISENLKLAFFMIRTKEKMSALVHLITEVIPKDDLTIIFAATKHHVEYVKDLLLARANIKCSAIFGSMDQFARQSNLDSFRKGLTRVLVVTDVAARGIDVPLLNNVINLEFPAQPKLFVHRVGRAARQGRSGTAYSFATQDELPYVVDLHLFLGRRMRGFDAVHDEDEVEVDRTLAKYDLKNMTTDDVDIGRFPQAILDHETERITAIVDDDPELHKLAKVVDNAHSLYVRTRKEASHRSVKRAKAIGTQPRVHPILANMDGAETSNIDAQLRVLRGFRPGLTVFELEHSKNGHKLGDAAIAMNKKRRSHGETIFKEYKRRDTQEQARRAEEAAREAAAKQEAEEKDTDISRLAAAAVTKEEGDEEEGPQRRRLSKAERKRLKKQGQPVVAPVVKNSDHDAEEEESKSMVKTLGKYDSLNTGAYRDEGFIPSVPQDYDAAASLHLSIANSGRRDDQPSQASRLEDALLDIVPDDQNDIMSKQRTYHWDKRKKKYVKASMEEHIAAKRIRNESGTLIRVKNRGELYEKWQKKTRKRVSNAGGEEGASGEGGKLSTNVRLLSRAARDSATEVPNSHISDEVKDEQTIRKERKEKQKRRDRNGPKSIRSANSKYKKPELPSKRAKGQALDSRHARSRIIVKNKSPRGKK